MSVRADGRFHDRQLAELALVVHVALAGLHVLGLLYNLRRRNWWHVAAHASAVAYDGWAAVQHIKELDGVC